MKKLILVALIASGLASAQNIPGVTINGKAIPERVFHSNTICGDLHNAIRDQAKAEAVRDMGITVTPEDIAAVRQTILSPDPVAESKRIIEHAALMISALRAVDRGQDPKQVYATMLVPKSVPQVEWDSYQAQWKDAAKRARIEQRLTITPEAVAKGLASVDLRPMATARKLDAAVDQELATRDPRFRTALEHWTASEYKGPNGQVGHRGFVQAEKDYLDAQREAYWKARESKLHVVLNEPTLAAQCGVAGAAK